MISLPRAISARLLADHVVDLEPQERRQLGHVDPGPVVEFGVHEPRAYGVHADAGAAQSPGQALGERDHPRLGRRIGRPPSGHQPGDTGDVDDGAGAGVEHGRQRGPGQVHHRGHVDVELRLQQGGIRRPEFAGRAEAGVVHQDRTPAASRSATLARSAGSAKSAGSTSTAAALDAQLARQFLQPLNIAGDQNQVIAVARVASRVAGADPGRGPGDQGNRTRHERQCTDRVAGHPARYQCW